MFLTAVVLGLEKLVDYFLEVLFGDLVGDCFVEV